MLRLQLAAVCAGLAYARTETSFEIHVSSNSAAPSDLSGSAAQGTAANPFGSVHAARDAMRAGLGAGKPRTVLISGDHHLSEPLRLDARDAASASSPVVWRSANLRDPARLTGGAKIPGDAFTAAGAVPSGAAGVMKVDLYSHGLNSTAIPGMSNPYPWDNLELFVDGTPMTRARYPNIADNGTWIWSGYENMSVPTLPNMTFTFKDTTAAEIWAPAVAKGDLWIHGFFKFDWRDTFIRIDKIESDGSGSYTVTRDAATPPQYPFTKGCRFYAVAALELLDAPGEYHVDKATGTLYFLPHEPMSASTDVVVSLIPNVVALDGAHHHSFKDMTISTSRDVAVLVTNSMNVTVDNCVVSNAGKVCLSLDGSNNTASSNTVFGCGSAAISISSGSTTTLQPGHTSVVGNTITNFSRIQRTYAAGIGFEGVANYVANNTITHAPHTAITGGGNDNVFEHNVLRHICYETVDTGAFYVGRSWSQRGNIVRFNTFDTVRATERLAQKSCSQNAFYLDDQMSGYDFYGNTVINATTGVLLGGGRRNRIHSNTFIDNDLDIAFDNRGMNWMADYCNWNCSGYVKNPAQGAGCFRTALEKLNYKNPPYSTHYPEIVNIYDNHPCVPINNVIEDNAFCHSNSLNESSRLGFVDQTESTVLSWLSTMSNNVHKC